MTVSGGQHHGGCGDRPEREAAPRDASWNTDAHYPTGSDAGYEFVLRLVNRAVGLIRRVRKGKSPDV